MFCNINFGSHIKNIDNYEKGKTIKVHLKNLEAFVLFCSVMAEEI